MNYLKINQFKCFDHVDIPINQLTLLAGANGYGKSTTIQSLLFLRQTIEECSVSDGARYIVDDIKDNNIALNGKFCLALGNSSFVLNRNHINDILTLGLYNDDEELTQSYYADNKEPLLWLTPKEFTIKGEVKFPILMHEFYYLNAERVGPRINQPLQNMDFPNVGFQGENTAQVIGLENGYYKICKKRRYPDTETYYLEAQVNLWLNFIMKGVRVKVETSPNTLTSQILLENPYTMTEPTLATNLGFGVSYVLPIIATGLIAKEGSYFIVENPEAHLHPSAQSKIGKFLAMVANSGVNVIIETHSDHIINSLQMAIASKTIRNDLVTINYFSLDEGGIQPEVQSISINESGELSYWPKGFFDQTQIDFSELISLRRNNE